MTLTILFIVGICCAAFGLSLYERYRKKGHTPKRPERGALTWTDSEGFDHDWKTDPPNGRVVVFSNPHGTDPTDEEKRAKAARKTLPKRAPVTDDPPTAA